VATHLGHRAVGPGAERSGGALIRATTDHDGGSCHPGSWGCA
jgi:hypothetical protein